VNWDHLVLARISPSYSRVRGRFLRITGPFATRLALRTRKSEIRISKFETILKSKCPKFKTCFLNIWILDFEFVSDFGFRASNFLVRSTRLVRLACLIHAASVHPEPGSNSQINAKNFKSLKATMKFLAHELIHPNFALQNLGGCSILLLLAIARRQNGHGTTTQYCLISIFKEHSMVILLQF